MSVRIEQENVIPRALSSSPSDCMVEGGGTIPASRHSFPGMEHDHSNFNGQSQETPTNGVAQIVGNSSAFDDKREIEAAAAPEALKKSTLTSPEDMETSAAAPVVMIPPEAPKEVSKNHALSPLHINVNECPKLEPNTNNHESELSNNGSLVRKKIFAPPSLKMPQRPSTSISTHVIMGPPSSTSTQVLLSPAGNLQNGYHLRRMSSGDASPSGFVNRPNSKTNKHTHPLAVQRNATTQRTVSNSGVGAQPNRPPSSLASPSGSVRKDHEMTRRRALVDRISKSRGPEYIHLLPQAEGLSHTQTSILLRKNRGVLTSEDMPYSMQKLIDCGAAPDRTKELFAEKIKDANRKRLLHADIDELTDVSDIEEEKDPNVDSEGRKSPKNQSRWAPKRMRFSGMLARSETLLEEKQALLGMLKTQNTVMNYSSGVRFAREEIMPRRRRQLNGMYYLYDKSAFRRACLTENECSRTLPIQSWTKRKLQSDVFGEPSIDKTPSNSAVLKTSANPTEKWVNTSQCNIVTYLANGEKREVTEFDYEEYKSGEGAQRIDELSSIDPVDFIVSSEFSPFEDRQMSYMHRLSTAPSNTIRKKHGKSIYFEAEERKAIEQNYITKKQSNKKKERKPMDEGSSDEEDADQASEPAAKRKSRGRPVTARRKTSRMSTSSRIDEGIYLDYLFEDNMFEDINLKQLPNKITYASIHVPDWSKISDDYWENVPCSKNVPTDDLKVSVARQHYRLMHAERERNKMDYDRRGRVRQSGMKSTANTPAHNVFDDMNNDSYPDFDMGEFETGVIKSRRLYANIEKPYEQRDFLNNQDPQ